MQVGQAFADAADQYVRKFLNNGVPSLFSDLKPVYRYCCAAHWSDAPLIRMAFAVLCCAVLGWAGLCWAVLGCAGLGWAGLGCAVLCCAVLCCAVLCCIVLYGAALNRLGCAVLCCAVLCCAVLAVLCCLHTKSVPRCRQAVACCSAAFAHYHKTTCMHVYTNSCNQDCSDLKVISMMHFVVQYALCRSQSVENVHKVH